MGKETVFTSQELATLGKLTVDLIQASIDAGEKEKAKKLSRRMYREFLAMHDLYRDWITALLTFIGKHYGDAVLYEALRESCAAWLKPLCDRYDNQEIRRKVDMAVAGFRGHLQAFRVEEDDEKITLIMDTCGSGGRLIQEGAYDPPRNFMKIKKAQPMTFNQPDFPVYCAHCFFQNNLPIELCGNPLFVTVPPKKIGWGPCRVYIFKE